MRFGIFYELQMPRPWAPDGEEKLVREALEQVELADRLGLDYVWEVEHHFLEEYSHSSAPEVFLAAASQRTKRMRLGHGIVQLPPAFNHPARVAERIGMLDLVSGGRVEFGTGQGSSQMELGGFGVDREQKDLQWEECLDAIVRMMTEEPFSGYEGRFFSMPPRNVVPKPKQKPHPPLWVACSRRETILQAARKGTGALSFSFVEPEQAKSWVDEYYSLIASPECVPAGLSVNPNVAVFLPFLCHQSEQTAIDRGIDGAHFFGFSLAYYYVFGKHKPGISNIWDYFLEHRSDLGFARELINPDSKPLGIKLLEQGLGSFRGAVGTPAQIRDLLERYERAGVDLAIFAAQAGNNQHEHICESLELFAKEVMPHFAERAAVREAEKKDRLTSAMEQALARRREVSHAAPREYVVTPQGEPGPVGTLRVFPSAEAHGERGRNGRPRPGKSATDRAGKAFLAWLVRGRSDRQLERMMPFLAPMIFKAMERAFRPDRAFGFSGELEYDVRVNGSSKKWAIRVEKGKATVRAGAAEQPRLTLKLSGPMFARISAGLVEPMTAVLEGKLEAEGELRLMNRIGEMFGGHSGY
jgi:alkanesulfonate monooxygenase SsuD/methylene tetrahydromethanopterin reductase-like flavin-dependent oxidoreductase (luciferase family)/putative sterol carrier protein